MKRHLIILAGVLMLGGTLLSCNKDDSASGNGNNTSSVTQNPLADTLWEEDDDTPLRMEFTGYTSVAVWGSYQARDTGSYKISGNRVIFSSLSTDDGWYEYTDGTFTNNTLIVNYKINGRSGYKCYLYKK